MNLRVPMSNALTGERIVYNHRSIRDQVSVQERSGYWTYNDPREVRIFEAAGSTFRQEAILRRSRTMQSAIQGYGGTAGTIEWHDGYRLAIPDLTNDGVSTHSCPSTCDPRCQQVCRLVCWVVTEIACSTVAQAVCSWVVCGPTGSWACGWVCGTVSIFVCAPVTRQVCQWFCDNYCG
jgi:hypothetical protein